MNITSWALSIVGLAAITLLCDIIMPEGETAKYIKGIFSLFIVFVIVSPLPGLLRSGGDYQSIFFENKAASVDYSFIDYTNRLKVSSLERDITIYLAQKGFSGTVVTVLAEFEGIQMDLRAVTVDLTSAKYQAAPDINKRVVELLTEYGIKKEIIFVYSG
jgi:hypothetical protein